MERTRLYSLDLFRGITIAGMILVNNPGSWKYVYSPLKHAEWHGWTPTDLVFPFFLFIVGVSITLSRRLGSGDEKKIFLRILKRSLILFILGLILHLFPFYHLSSLSGIRIPGVLQRIAVCYFFSSILYIRFRALTLIIITLLILIGYWMIMMLIPVPGYGGGVLSPEGNLAAYVDRALLKGTKLYGGKWDPEGILSTFPAIATTLLGVLTGFILKTKYNLKIKSIIMVLWGVTGILIGYILSQWFPINKNLWTSSYVIFTGGVALIFFSFCFLVCEIIGWKVWAKPFVFLGMNSIAAYFLSGILTKTLIFIKLSDKNEIISLYSWIYKNLFSSWAGPLNGSLFFALFYVLFWIGVMAAFYKKGIFIKI